ncbi:hypothetical protein, variant [Verruconis gallopava]|uniref:Subtelomeric hrmA-associated cluster protein AFUB-079030/YDR124W-like helical bundle domain-containing protein n=1 Tax=Verruconis gallopava TaxID=253628 RepID=A0A0D2AS52_9PEZI|nr:uncharacterized protein PV09_00267 [Verruconis gallopava]XP_016219239.1 hypothetical protein, variant [Verruconis gallopava]KIW09369.1 hypothetical protein PV09_00267 [Verruconis gallopava]KIW09370.1 hypothetical protein, variant [Verruconis gallopava]
MAIGDVQDDGRPFGDVKQNLPLLQLPRSSGYFGNGHLPLAPADTRDQYLDARADPRNHPYQTNLSTPIDGVPTPFTGLAFNETQDGIRPSARRLSSQHSVTFTVHGLDDPTSAELQLQHGNVPTSEQQRSRLERFIRKLYSEPAGPDSKFSTPIRHRTTSADGSRRGSWTPDYRGSNYRFISQGGKRPADRQASRTCTPDDEDDDGEYLPMDYVPMQQIRLGDENAILAYYDAILRGIQQLALKQVLKEWIKTIEPKKQKNCPYKKGIRPKWWPEQAAYKEPDHIKVEDRIHLAIGIIRHAQDPKELNGEGLAQLERVASRQDLIFDQEPPEKQAFRKRLLDNLFTLARHEQQVKNDERDITEVVSLPMVKKFERPNKKRKKTSDKSKGADTDSTIVNGDDDGKTPNGLLKPITLGSNGERDSTTPNTPSWRQHSTQDSGISFPRPNDQGHDQHIMSYSQQYDSTGQMDSRYSSFDGSPMDGSDSSPISGYPSGTSTGGGHMMYSTSAQSVSMGYEAPIHSLSTMQNHDGAMMSGMMVPSHGRPQLTTVYNAVTESDDRSWQATPASYMPQAQPFATPSFYA